MSSLRLALGGDVGDHHPRLRVLIGSSAFSRRCQESVDVGVMGVQVPAPGTLTTLAGWRKGLHHSSCS